MCGPPADYTHSSSLSSTPTEAHFPVNDSARLFLALWPYTSPGSAARRMVQDAVNVLDRCIPKTLLCAFMRSVFQQPSACGTSCIRHDAVGPLGRLMLRHLGEALRDQDTLDMDLLEHMDFAMAVAGGNLTVILDASPKKRMEFVGAVRVACQRQLCMAEGGPASVGTRCVVSAALVFYMYVCIRLGFCFVGWFVDLRRSGMSSKGHPLLSSAQLP